MFFYIKRSIILGFYTFSLIFITKVVLSDINNNFQEIMTINEQNKYFKLFNYINYGIVFISTMIYYITIRNILC